MTPLLTNGCLQTGTLIQHLIQPEGSKHGMCMAVQLYMQSGQKALHALVGYENGTVAVWDVAAGNLLASKQLHAEPVMALAVAADGSGLHPSQRICTCKLL